MTDKGAEMKVIRKNPFNLFILFFLFMMVGSLPIQAQPHKTPEELNRSLRQARENFLKKDFEKTSEDIQAAAVFLRKEASRAKGNTRQALTASAEKLDKLAVRAKKGTPFPKKSLNVAFAQAHQSLARYYYDKASESWERKSISEAGHYLKLAGVQIKEALILAGDRIESDSAAALEKVKQIGEKMKSGLERLLPEAGEGFRSLKKLIDEADHKIEALSFRSTPIRISEKPKETVNLDTALTRVAKENIPAVVYVEVIKSREVTNPFYPFEHDPSFRQFFNIPRTPRNFKEELRGLGSGMIVDTSGHILTNHHVVEGATRIEVTLADGSKYPARVVGMDPKTDLAVIRIAPLRNLSKVTFGDSDGVEIGEWVVAIGAPQALENSVTKGIISAKHRTGITDESRHQDFLQTDAAINPGNSGGPLLNLYGQVIGVNTAIFTESGGFEGIGFTIPSNLAVRVANELIAHGKVGRGWL
jgi:S1-C subfamily serine protease